MRALGHQRFMVAGHDRGGRVAYRLALDHPEAVRALIPIDIVPTAEVWRRTKAERAIKSYHWAFLAQPHPLPETLIGKEPVYYLEHTLKSWAEAAATSRPSRRRRWRTTARCCRSRPACTPSARTIAPAPPSTGSLDEADLAAGRKIACPTFVLWASDYLGRRRHAARRLEDLVHRRRRRRGRLRPFHGRGEPEGRAGRPAAVPAANKDADMAVTPAMLREPSSRDPGAL